jgi:S1-C subfamily serine protease
VDERLNRLARARLGFDGVMVLRVEPGSSAARAGIRGITLYPDGSFDPGDIIVAVEGEPVRTVEELRKILDRHRIGDEVTVTFAREGRLFKTKLILEAQRS